MRTRASYEQYFRDLLEIDIMEHTNWDGFVYQTFPADLAVLDRCEPVYEELPGWKCETSHVTRYEDLPENARKYVERVLELVGGKLGVLSVGPARETTLRIGV